MSTTNFLIDTSFHVAYVVSSEEQNQLARNTIDYLKQTYDCPGFITTHTIFLETHNFIMHSKQMRKNIEDKKERKKLADYICQEIITHCEVRMIPADMLGDIWELYTSKRAQELHLEYVDCCSMVYMRDISKVRYKEDHRLKFKGILSFNPRHFGEPLAKEFGFKYFDFSEVEEFKKKRKT